MDITALGSRGYLVTFDELLDTEFDCTTNVYLMKDEAGNVLVDSFLGPDIMAKMVQALAEDPDKVRYVINTHSDWDHIWGNAYFKNALVIAHQYYPDRIKAEDEEASLDLKRYAMGEIADPHVDILFDYRISLPDLDLEVFYSPGHSDDSISVYDARDRILIVGDNCEYPIPSYVDRQLLEEHSRTLEHYLEYDFEFVVPGHGPILTRTEVKTNLEYIKDLIDKPWDELKKYEEAPYRFNHLINQAYFEEQDPLGDWWLENK